ncbi:uncharacterized protein LOC133179218 [Saccostrea echinata]|uniref:uncharacterized protein LOC133179218 n=1 Tax=Saccostrea echinata TaxID=191078 RepID=UPI002A833145|nr:uncharacterized protein LOC133179218 [Saccostrea echinata]
MFSIKKLKASKPKPYSNPLRVRIFGSSNPSKYMTADGRERKSVTLGAADQEDAIKIVLYDLSKLTSVKDQDSVLLTNYVYKIDPCPCIILTTVSKVMKTLLINVPPHLQATAKSIANSLPAKSVAIRDVKTSPVKTMVTIKGRVTSEEMVRTVQVRGSDVEVRNIRVNDGTEEIKVSLWRELVSMCKVGEYLEFSNVVTSSYQEEVSVSTTQRTTIQPCEAPPSVMEGKLIAFEKKETMYSLMIGNERNKV